MLDDEIVNQKVKAQILWAEAAGTGGDLFVFDIDVAWRSACLLHKGSRPITEAAAPRWPDLNAEPKSWMEAGSSGGPSLQGGGSPWWTVRARSHEQRGEAEGDLGTLPPRRVAGPGIISWIGQ